MLKIINVEEKECFKREDGSVFGLDLEITFNNNVKYTHYFSFITIEEAREYLYNIDWTTEVIESLERFAQDEESANENHENSYEKLIGKIEDDVELTEEDLKCINECVSICTYFKDFDYKIYLG